MFYHPIISNLAYESCFLVYYPQQSINSSYWNQGFEFQIPTVCKPVSQEINIPNQTKLNDFQIIHQKQQEKSSICQYSDFFNFKTPKIKLSSKPSQKHSNYSVILQKPKQKEIRLDYRIQWKNQNRNIVPNIANQMVSYLLKKSKSQRLVRKIFQHHAHSEQWTEIKFYHYMKKIKESITHYLNENVIRQFFEIHQPNCQLYTEQEQQFYMKVCRITILKFLRDDAVLIPLTSNRMSEEKRMIHLIARQALQKKFIEISHEIRP